MSKRPAPHLQAWFRPVGFTLRLVTNSRAILHAAEQSFGGFGPQQPAGSPDLAFYLFEHNRPDSVPLKQPVYRPDGPRVYHTMGRASHLAADRQRGVAYGLFSSAVVAAPAFFRWHFLELALFVMLPPRGLLGVHGAGLVKNGRAILLRAASGGGKSTLAFAGARNGWQVLAEDVVWLDTRRDCWWGMPWTFHLLPDAVRLFPELATVTPRLQTSGETKLEVNLEACRPGSTVVKARPGPVVLLERCPGRQSRLEPVGPDKARPLWLAASAGTETDFPGYRRHINRLLSRRVYRLFAGNNIEATLALLDTLAGPEPS